MTLPPILDRPGRNVTRVEPKESDSARSKSNGLATAARATEEEDGKKKVNETVTGHKETSERTPDTNGKRKRRKKRRKAGRSETDNILQAIKLAEDAK